MFGMKNWVLVKWEDWVNFQKCPLQKKEKKVEFGLNSANTLIPNPDRKYGEMKN